jgi:biotin carboxyl carrier protein
MRWTLKIKEGSQEQSLAVELQRISEGRYVFLIGDEEVVIEDPVHSAFAISSPSGEAICEVWQKDRWRARWGDQILQIEPQQFGEEAGGSSRLLKAQMPGKVLKLLVQEGQEIDKNQSLLILEAMKMENEIRAEKAGVIAKILVKENQSVESGAVLIEFKEPGTEKS